MNLEKENIEAQIPKEKRLRDILGPGLVTGAADDDPSGIATYSQAGAQTGFGLLWLSVFTIPFMILVQEVSARIALVTGRGLASNIKKYFSKKTLIFVTILLVIANTFNIGADLAIMASVTNHLLPVLPAWFYLIAIALVTVVFEIFVSYKKYSRYLKWLTLALLAYVATALLIKFDYTELFKNAFFPSWAVAKANIYIIAAILGTTISPYLFFWQASQEIEDEIGEGNDTEEKRAVAGEKNIKNMRIDVAAGMFFSNLIMFFIIAVCAETLFKNGITNINGAGEAAEALRPLAGHFAYLLFSLGILGTGLLALPVLAGSSAYAIAETFDWKEGLYRKWNGAKAFYSVIAFSMLLGLLFSFLHINPIKSLVYSAVLNGIVAPIIIFFLIVLSQNAKVMGERKNKPLTNVLGWFLTAIMGVVAILTVVDIVRNGF